MGSEMCIRDSSSIKTKMTSKFSQLGFKQPLEDLQRPSVEKEVKLVDDTYRAEIKALSPQAKKMESAFSHPIFELEKSERDSSVSINGTKEEDDSEISQEEKAQEVRN